MYDSSCARLAWFAVALIVQVGCGQAPSRNATVSGTVVVDGSLAERGTVTFHPDGDGPLAVGRIMSDGSFTARTGKGNLTDVDRGTLKSGKYKVTIVVPGESAEPIAEGGPPKAGPRLTAAKYASAATTDIERMVEPGDNLFVFEIERAATTDASGDALPGDETPPASESTESDEAVGDQQAPADESSAEADVEDTADTGVDETDDPQENQP